MHMPNCSSYIWIISSKVTNRMKIKCYIQTGNRTSEYIVKNQMRHAHKSKDDRKQTKTTGLILKDTEVKRWPYVHQVYLVVQPHALVILVGLDMDI